MLKKTRFYGLTIALSLFIAALGFSSPSQANFSCQSVYKYSDIKLRLVTAAVREESEIPSLKVMAYNVENLFTSTGKAEWVSPGEMKKDKTRGPELKSEAKIAEIRKMILRGDADVLILTEVESIQALSILASHELDGKYKPLLIEGNDARGIDIGFLVKTDLPWNVKILSHKELRWTNPKTNVEGPLFSRDLPVLEFRRNEKDETPLFAVFGNHAKSKRDMNGDPESKDWRSAQYIEATKIIEGYIARQIPTMLAGDFNADIRFDSEVLPLKKILVSSLDSAPDALPADQRVTHSFHPRGGEPHYSQMDDVMVSKGLEKSIISSQILRYTDKNGQELPLPKSYDQRSLQPSDHFPVLMTISTKSLF